MKKLAEPVLLQEVSIDALWELVEGGRSDLPLFKEILASGRSEVHTIIAGTHCEDFLNLAAESNKVEFREAAANNIYTPKESLADLAKDTELQVRSAVYNNPAAQFGVISLPMFGHDKAELNKRRQPKKKGARTKAKKMSSRRVEDIEGWGESEPNTTSRTARKPKTIKQIWEEVGRPRRFRVHAAVGIASDVARYVYPTGSKVEINYDGNKFHDSNGRTILSDIPRWFLVAEE